VAEPTVEATEIDSETALGTEAATPKALADAKATGSAAGDSKPSAWGTATPRTAAEALDQSELARSHMFHLFGITAPLAALTLLYGRQPLPFMVLIPMVCWARVYLKAHTVAQVAAGVALAIATTAFFFSLFHVGLLSAH